MAGTLVGRVGESGKAFVVGEQYEGSGAQEGKLYLHIVPSPWNNASSGTYRVRIRSERLSLAERVRRSAHEHRHGREQVER